MWWLAGRGVPLGTVVLFLPELPGRPADGAGEAMALRVLVPARLLGAEARAAAGAVEIGPVEELVPGEMVDRGVGRNAAVLRWTRR